MQTENEIEPTRNESCSTLIWRLLVILVSLCGCDSADPDPDSNPYPYGDPTPLEQLSGVPFDDLGSGKLAFERIANEGSMSGVYVIDLDSRENWGFSASRHSTQLSHDGTQLLYTALTPYDANNNTYWDPHTSDLRGENAKIIIKLPGNHGPVSWSANGRQVLFPGFLSVAQLTTGVRWVDVATGTVERVFANPGGVPHPNQCGGASTLSQVDEHHDGRVVAIGQMSCGASISILILKLDDSFEELLGPDDFIAAPFSPVWSRDESKIAFLDLSETETNVRIINEDGTELNTILSLERHTPINWSGDNNNSLAWSPDDSRIAFTHSDAPDQQHIYVIRLIDGELIQVTNTPGAHDRSISWGMIGQIVGKTRADD